MQVSDAVFKPWIEGNLKSAEAILSREIGDRSHHALANRALVRTHLKQWDAAVGDAKKVPSLPVFEYPAVTPLQSIAISPSPIAHIAHAVALLGQYEKRSALQAFDLAFCHCDATENRFILLTRVYVRFRSTSFPTDFILHRPSSCLYPENAKTQ